MKRTILCGGLGGSGTTSESSVDQDRNKSEVRKREQTSWWTGEIVQGKTVKVRVDQDPVWQLGAA